VPSTNTWTEEAPLLVGKSESTAGLLGSTIVSADGYSSSEDTGDNDRSGGTLGELLPLTAVTRPV